VSISLTFLAKSKWQKAQSCQLIAKNGTLCAKIRTLCKKQLFVIRTKMPHIIMLMKLMPGGRNWQLIEHNNKNEVHISETLLGHHSEGKLSHRY
jgi:hypothetical protein